MRATLLFMALLLFPFLVFPQAGDPVTFFTVGSGFNGETKTISQQTDGKFIIGGAFTSYNGNPCSKIVRLLPSGLIDTTFNIGSGFNGSVTKVLSATHGICYVAGSFSTYNGQSVSGFIKLDSIGSLIPTFTPTIYGIFDFDIDSMGRAVIGGSFTNVNGQSLKHIARLDTLGAVDTTFKIGIGFTGFGVTINPVYSVKIQNDGKILAGGDFIFYQNYTANKMCRIKENGDVDSSFCNNLVGGFDNVITNIKIQSDGKIVVGGKFTSCSGSTVKKIARLEATGLLDINFNNSSVGPDGDVNVIVIENTGKIYVGGSFNFYGNAMVHHISRLTSQGVFDPSFAVGNGFSGSYPKLYDLHIVNNDTSIIALGSFENYKTHACSSIVKIKRGAIQLYIPTLTSYPATQVSNVSAKLGGSISSNGGAPILDKGICWGTTSNPSISGNHTSISGTDSNFFKVHYHFSDSTKYYVRAYATNSVGTAYGNEITFTTRSNSTYGCGNVSFTYLNQTVTYGTVRSFGGYCWLDRNLGADSLPESAYDSDAYGDYFQFGREDDGHQRKNSGTSNQLSTSNSPNHNDFILAASQPYNWMTAEDNSLWQGINGQNNPCPTGFRLPTKTEATSEVNSWSAPNSNGAFESPLRIVNSGMRGYLGGSLVLQNSDAFFWTSTISNGLAPNINAMNITSTSANPVLSYRAAGFAVRCIKDYTNGMDEHNNGIFRIYPNPSSGTVNVLIDPVFGDEFEFQVVDLTGKTLNKGKFSYTESTISIENLPKGYYLLILKNEKTTSSAPLIKL